MATYNFERELVEGRYNIDNKYCIDGEGKRVPLAKEIQEDETLPDSVKVICKGADCDVIFDVTLDSGQETTLNTIVADHKAHTGG